ncbi:MAG: hypothetical protein DYG98_10450 [Haliscomenobacteraceae bacterium CHB4]|nr:hypothetical protein [Haliscomenobacteraceae bacterium CHB4]
MYIAHFAIQNFKSFEAVTLDFNPDLNILTGKNNSGKTTVLEALALWHECFNRLLNQAQRREKNYQRGQWVLGPTYNKYFPFEQINSIRSPYFEDIFRNRDKRNTIKLSATFKKDRNEQLEIPIQIGQSGLNYVIEVEGFASYNFDTFNHFFRKLPQALGLYYASPVSAIQQIEDFVTEPQLKGAILRRASATVLRNRLCKLLSSPDTTLQTEYLRDLAYLLYNNQQEIHLIARSSIQRDTRASVNFKIGNDDVEKDIALLGSGSLQAIEILLNLYQPGEMSKDLNLVLLDEPDSHIHRDMQQRLTNILTKFSNQNQIFISTHNESFIRSANHHHLFHLEGRPVDEIRSVDQEVFSKIQPRFKGIYPSQINPILRSIGSVNGLDFINALESDKLIFVEGEDDARALNLLLRQQVANRKKYMFWVLGGIAEVFEHIQDYQTVFSYIKNTQSLWEKSNLVFDKDFLTDDHKKQLETKFKEKLGIAAFSWNAYTIESTLFTDLDKLTTLISLWIKQETGQSADENLLSTNIKREYEKIKALIEVRYADKFIEEVCYRYQNIRNKTERIFGSKNIIIKENDIQLATLVRSYQKECLDTNAYFKLMTKDDVGLILNKVVAPFNLTFSVETDFIEIIKLVNKSLWLNEWDFLTQL